jgi:hypothetical protein
MSSLLVNERFAAYVLCISVIGSPTEASDRLAVASAEVAVISVTRSDPKILVGKGCKCR